MDSPLFDDHLQMTFVERDYEIKTLSTQGAAPSLTDCIRFRRPHRRSQHGNAHFLHPPVELPREDAVSVVDHVSIPVASWQCLTELLKGPLHVRMRGDVLVDNASGRHFHDHEHI